MSKPIKLLLTLLLLAPLCHAETRFLHAGTLLAIPGETPLTEQTLVIQGASST